MDESFPFLLLSYALTRSQRESTYKILAHRSRHSSNGKWKMENDLFFQPTIRSRLLVTALRI